MTPRRPRTLADRPRRRAPARGIDYVEGGVRARRSFANGETIERAPVIVVPQEQWDYLAATPLGRCCCSWGNGLALVFGLVPFCRRSPSANAILVAQQDELAVEVVAVRDIGAAEEIIVPDDAGGEPLAWLSTPAPPPATPGSEAVTPSVPPPAPDPRPLRLPLARDVALELVRVPAGEFTLGSPPSDPDARAVECPAHRLTLGEYWVGRTPVTVAQFESFAAVTGYRTLAERDGWGWVLAGGKWDNPAADFRYPAGKAAGPRLRAEHPVTMVAWEDAVEFCRWASSVTGRRVRLPVEPEWERAARGPDGRRWPWGNEPPDAGRCNFAWQVGDTTPVGTYSPQGDSPYGCADMAGNVWEWQGNAFSRYPWGARPANQATRAWRGGAFSVDARRVRAACRYWYGCAERSNILGFRVVVDPAEETA